MHLLFAVEGCLEAHEKVKEWFSSIRYDMPDGSKSRPIAREIRFYDVVLDESVKDEFIFDLGTRLKIEMFSGRSLKPAMKIMNKFLPVDLIDTDVGGDGKRNRYERLWRENYSITPPYVFPIGSLPDMKNDEGLDMR